MLASVSTNEDPPPRQFKLKPKEFARVNAPPGTEARSDDHDVYAIRRQLREREQAAGLDDLAPAPPRKSRRTRDFLLSLALGWGALLTIGGLVGRLLGIAAAAGLGLAFSAGVWWIFFHILSDY